MTEAIRPVDVEVLSDGTQRAYADSIPSQDRVAIEVPLLPRKVVPVVFLPGIMANAPGGLQLLPSERYGMGWLKAKVNGEEITLGPTGDPYAEIHANEEKWYRLINREWVNPADQLEATWKRKKNGLLDPRDFHRDIASRSKAGMTYVSFCADEKQKTWGDVVWEAGSAPFFHGGASQQLGLERLHIASDAQHWVINRDDGTGTVILHDGMNAQPFGVHIAAPSEAGDGTVPLRSGEDPVKQGKATVSSSRMVMSTKAASRIRP